MTVNSSPARLYIDLVKKSLMCTLYEDLDGCIPTHDPGLFMRVLRAALPAGADIVWKADPAKRDEGHDWPRLALTMTGRKRLDNLQQCVEAALDDGVPGDFIETGVWRGGSCILMRALLAARGVTDRRVFVADSFMGVPPPDAARYPADDRDPLHRFPALAVSEARVRAAFDRYGLLDDQVRFLAGWFKDTLPVAPISALAVARLDGDLYESTWDALTHLYPRLSPGGFLIVDDYGCIPACRQAVEDYRRQHGITEPVQAIDWSGVFWRRQRA